MTLEERLQQIIGQQAFTIAALQTELEKAREQLATLESEKAAKADSKRNPDAPLKTVTKLDAVGPRG